MRKFLLLPFTIIYGIVIAIRNFLFETGIMRSEEFDVPTIGIGNITVGGTGKTPFSEYLIRILSQKFNVGYLSRGYKRKTKGYFLSTTSSTYKEIGDEALQIKTKFPEITVAVDEKRVNGLNELTKTKNPPDVILLDDVFQHRSVNTLINILLIDYNRPISHDWLLPSGNLREFKSAINRASIIIFTKCPPGLTPIEQRILKKSIKTDASQDIYFTSIKYGEITPVAKGYHLFSDDLHNYTVLLVTGIAVATPLKEYIDSNVGDVVHMNFQDHHHFSLQDIQKITKMYEEISSSKKMILTTEKDLMRLVSIENKPEVFTSNLYYIPIEIAFLEDKKSFDSKLIENVTENKSNSQLFKI